METRDFEDLVHEKDLCEWLGVRPAVLAEWRQKGLPVARLHRSRRAYWRDDVIRFISDKLTAGSPGRDSEKLS